jgi:hypothetical protein
LAKPLKVDPFASDVELRSLLIALLKKRKGIGIDLFGVLQIDDQENGHVRVLDQREWDQDITKGAEYLFQDVKKGVDFFLEIRKERKLGYDFYRHHHRQVALDALDEAYQTGEIRLIDDEFSDCQNDFSL